MFSRGFRLISVGTAMLLALTACGGSEAAEGGAQDEASSGQVTLYSPAAGEFQRVIQRFNEDYPNIRVNPVMLAGSELGTRLQSEFTSGQSVGDVVMTSTTSSAGPWVEGQEDWFEPYIPDNADELRPEALNKEEGWFAAFSSVFGATYNTETISEDEVPRSWDELTDPKWDNRISMGDPRRQALTSVTFVGLLGNDVVDDQWFSDLAELQPRPLDTPQVQQSLVSGQTDLAIWGLGFTSSAKADGAPLEFIPELGVESLNGAALLKNAPNPEAAKVFLDWTVSENGQAALSESGFMPQTKGSSWPEGLSPDVDMPVVPPYEEAAVLTKEVIDTWTGLLG